MNGTDATPSLPVPGHRLRFWDLIDFQGHPARVISNDPHPHPTLAARGVRRLYLVHHYRDGAAAEWDTVPPGRFTPVPDDGTYNLIPASHLATGHRVRVDSTTATVERAFYRGDVRGVAVDLAAPGAASRTLIFDPGTLIELADGAH